MLTQAELNYFDENASHVRDDTQRLIEEIQELQLQVSAWRDSALRNTNGAIDGKKVYAIYVQWYGSVDGCINVCDSLNVAYLVADSAEHFPGIKPLGPWHNAVDVWCRVVKTDGYEGTQFQFIEESLILGESSVHQSTLPNPAE